MEAVQGDIENLPFNDEKFDLVYCVGVLMRTNDTDRGVAELLRVLKPGGQAILSFNNTFKPFSPMARWQMRRKRKQIPGYVQKFCTPKKFASFCQPTHPRRLRFEKTTMTVGLGPAWMIPFWKAIDFAAPTGISYEPVVVVEK